MNSLNVLRNRVSQVNWYRLITTSSVYKNADVKKDESINKDRSQEISVETSIRYLKSSAYKKTYGDHLIWTLYRRNFKGLHPPKKTRRTCIRSNKISTGNPCPICRDEYLVLNEENIDLLKQFVCPHTGSILSYSKTGLCQRKHQELVVSIERAWDRGLLTFDVPFRHYDYSEYYSSGN